MDDICRDSSISRGHESLSPFFATRLLKLTKSSVPFLSFEILLGMQRAQCLRNVFGASSGYNIQKIYAQTPKSSGKRRRPLDTVTPLANDLGLTVDISCDRDDPDCVKDSVNDYADKNSGNILICWEHGKFERVDE